jgi:hypothetical protein
MASGRAARGPKILLLSNMTSVKPPDVPAEEPQATQDLSSVFDSSETEDPITIHWAVDLGEELTVGDVADYMNAFKKVVDTGEWLGLMPAQYQSGALIEVPAGQTVVQKLSYGSPWSIILSAPKQLAEGIVCVLDFVVNVPANVREHWSKAGEAKVRKDLLKYLADEVQNGRTQLTQDQIFLLLASADLKALQILATSGQLVTYSIENPKTGAKRKTGAKGKTGVKRIRI